MNPPPLSHNNPVSTSSRRKREAERSVNWTVEETQVLLCAWSDERIQKSLAENLRNRHVFKHLSSRMCELGFSRSPHQCRLRVKTLKANYVRAKLQHSVDSSQPCTFKYFAEMDAVLGRRPSEALVVSGVVPGHHHNHHHQRHHQHPAGPAGGFAASHVSSATAGERPRSLSSDASPRMDTTTMTTTRGGHFGSLLGPSGTQQHLSSSFEDRGGGGGGGVGRYAWPLNPEVKLEDDREDSTEEFEYSDTGASQPLRDRRHSAFLESAMLHEPAAGHPQEDDLSTPSTLEPPPPPPLPRPPTLLLPPKLSGCPLPLAPDPTTTTTTTTTALAGGPMLAHGPASGPALQPQCPSSSLEPTLTHLSECFQRLVSETRGLLLQLEGQRQEQARWHQDLLAHWLEREERRQREAADREERREKARMEHEIKVLELLTGLAAQQRTPPPPPPPTEHRCRCASADGNAPVAESSTSAAAPSRNGE